MKTIQIPASKSHTIRALLIATLAKGKSVLKHPLTSSDTLSCLNACKMLGAKVLRQTDDEWILEGIGLPQATGNQPIDLQNSGTSLFLATAVAALSNTAVSFTGDEQLQRRSAAPLLAALESLGATTQSNNGCVPYTIKGPLVGGEATLECPTSQYLSALLLVSPLLPTETRLHIPLLNEFPYIQMTLRWLEAQGAQIHFSEDHHEWTISPLFPGKYSSYQPIDCTIPADFSSASFFLAYAALSNSHLWLDGLDMSDTQGDKEIVNHLIKMGAQVQIHKNAVEMLPRTPYTDLQAITMDLNATPDALPILAVVGAFANGTTRLTNVAHARLKETDRVACICTELRKLGFDAIENADGLAVVGQPMRLQNSAIGNSKKMITEVEVNGYGDHRMVMSLAIASAVGDTPLAISTREAAAVTFPNFFELLESVQSNSK